MLKLVDTERVAAQPASVLDRIATALGVEFEEPANPTSTDLDHTVELLRLWARLGHEQDRMKVLCFLRTVAA